MLFTTHDPRHDWWLLTVDRPLSAEEDARLRALPTGARTAPREWVWTSRVEQRWHFDKDEQGEVAANHTIITGWCETRHPLIERAGALSLHGVEEVPSDLLARFPGRELLGDSISALTLPGHILHPGALEHVGQTRAWADLSLWGTRVAAPVRAAAFRELAAGFPALLGLELHGSNADRDDLEVLASASFAPTLEDLTITGRALDPEGMRALAGQLQSLVHLDLRDARLGPETIAALAPKLGRARRLQLSYNPMGDVGLRALLEAGALEHVSDLWLNACELGDASAHALAGASLPALRGLWLSGNTMSDEGIAALVRAPFFARLEGADLSQRGLGERTRALLEGHPLAGCVSGTARRPGVQALWFLGRGPSA